MKNPLKIHQVLMKFNLIWMGNWKLIHKMYFWIKIWICSKKLNSNSNYNNNNSRLKVHKTMIEIFNRLNNKIS